MKKNRFFNSIFGMCGRLFLIFIVLLGFSNRGSAENPSEKFLSPSLGMEFVRIPGGCFSMGDATGFEYEKPVHEVCVGDYYLGKYEVTQKQWMMLMNENRSRFMGENHPVQRVSWDDAMEFIRRLNKKEGSEMYRLPTEAEWEYAARAGTTTRYYWGDKVDNEYVWFYGSSQFTAHPVGKRKPNAFGLYDMSGSVWEWVSDWYGYHYYKESPKDNPQGPETGTFRTRRGGSMANLASYVRSASRYRNRPDKRHYILGLRVARTIN